MKRKTNISILVLLLFFASCNKHLSEVSIYSNLQEGDSISVALYSKIENRYITVNGTTVTSADAISGRLDIPLPDSIMRNIGALSISIHSRYDKILEISSIILNDNIVINPEGILNTLGWQYGLIFEIDPKTNILISHIKEDIPGIFPVFFIAAFYKPHPIGFQLFLRISLVATLLFFVLILCKQASSQRFLVFTIALFLAAIPLKMNYTDYFMGLMALSIFLAFIYNKPRRFTWQPIFYILCIMYFMDIIGLTYTGDFYSGLKRLDRGIQLVLFPIIFSMIHFPKKNVILLLRFFLWSVITFCIFGLFSYATIVSEFTWDTTSLESKYFYAPLLMMWPAHPHPSYLSTILLMAVPIALYLRYQDKKQITMVEALLGVLLPIVFTVLGGARVGMVIAPVLLVLGYLFYCKFSLALKLGLVVAGLISGGILLYIFPKVDDLSVDPIRADLRKTAISAIKEKPVFGWGTGYSKSLIQSKERAHGLGIEKPYDFNQFHNQYLEDMVQFGIPGIFILMVLFCWMLWVGIRGKNFLLLSLFVIYALFCWTESVLYVSKGVLPFVFWLCFLMSNRKVLIEY